MERMIKRGDIFYAELNPVIGSEQGGTRPVLVISNNIGNRHSPTVIIAPITSRTHTKAKLPTHTEVKDFNKLDKDSIILLEQIRTIDKQRLKQYMPLFLCNDVLFEALTYVVLPGRKLCSSFNGFFDRIVICQLFVDMA